MLGTDFGLFTFQQSTSATFEIKTKSFSAHITKIPRLYEEPTTMSYNPRMSIAPNTQQQNRGKKKDEESDAFMRLVSSSMLY